MSNLYYTFKTTGSTNSLDRFQLFLDANGNIVTGNNVEYGVYNKIISLRIEKLLYIKIKKIGFGDIIDFFTKKTGLKSLIVFLTDGNCGCEERRVKFNKFKIPYWVSIKTRPLYDTDHYVLKRNKNLLFKQLKEKITTPVLANNAVEQQTKQVGKPVTKEEIKRSCGCGKTKSLTKSQNVV
jgi:hypothetical protein